MLFRRAGSYYLGDFWSIWSVTLIEILYRRYKISSPINKWSK